MKKELEILPILNSSLSHFITLPVSINHRKTLHGCKGFFADTTDSVDWLTDAFQLFPRVLHESNKYNKISSNGNIPPTLRSRLFIYRLKPKQTNYNRSKQSDSSLLSQKEYRIIFCCFLFYFFQSAVDTLTDPLSRYAASVHF